MGDQNVRKVCDTDLEMGTKYCAILLSSCLYCQSERVTDFRGEVDRTIREVKELIGEIGNRLELEKHTPRTLPRHEFSKTTREC